MGCGFFISKKIYPDNTLQSIEKILQKGIVADPDDSNTIIEISSLWKKHSGPTIIEFFRRWGCPLCRLVALELSDLKPLLDMEFGEGTIGLYGVGFQTLGYKEFKEGNFFKGDIFIDSNKILYTGLKYPSGTKNFMKLMNKNNLKRIKEAKKRKVTGNFEGDGFQFGGTVIVSSEGKVIYHKPQLFFGDNPKNIELIEILEDYYEFLKSENLKL